MAKNKEEKLDDLEIISIGKLYSGPWEKKYWSSSRGKDRYPYPIGYKTSRTLNGVNYKMEILEGLKGPLFVIMSSDENSCSAQTPDIAWESFQKKSSSRTKLLPGKRFSCKIDGVEFFGFKNAFVQRLLRELVANVGGTAEQTSSLSSLLIEAPHTVHEVPSTVSNKHLDLLPYLPKQRVTGKRSRRDKSVHMKPLTEANCKCQPPNSTRNVDDANARQRNKGNSDRRSPSSFGASNKACGSMNSTGVLKVPNLAGVVEKEQCLFSAQGEMQSDVMDISDHHKLGDLPQEREAISSEHHLSTKADSLPEGELANRPITTEVHQCNNSIFEEKKGDTLLQHDKQVEDIADFCAPDTLDVVGDSISHSGPNKYVKASCNASDDTVATDVADSEVLTTDSLQEDETGTANVSSEGFDIDSVGQEIAKSMMTVLLPRALPLLKTFSRKRKKSTKPSEMPLNRSQSENNASIGDAIDVKEHIENSNMEREKETGSIPCARYDSVLSTSGITESIVFVPDSFDSNESRYTAVSHHDLFSNTAKGHQASRSLNHYGHQTLDLPVSVDAEAESPVAAIAMRDHKRNLDSELKMAGNDDSQEDIRTTGGNLLGKTNSSLRHPAEKMNINSKQARVGGNSNIKVPASVAPQLRSPSTEHTICRDFRNVCPMEKSEASLLKKFHNANFADIDNSMSYLQMPSTSCCSDATETKDMTNDLRSNFQGDSKPNEKPQDLLKHIACYNHPMTISTVLLQTKESEIYLCVVCGSLEKQSTLFVYKDVKKAEKVGFPSFLGHASIAFRFDKDAFSRDINIDSSRLQFTPDAQSLVLVNSIKTPFCREGKLDCSCACCTSEFSEKNAVKIVRVKTGYVTIETMLKTTEGASCLLVCEPSFLLVAEEGGKLNLWVMNSSWSAQEEKDSLPTLDSMLPCLVELKRIPKSTVLAVGHNGFGEFGLWDVENRILVSKFSAPGTSVFQYVPVGMFRWQSKGQHKSTELVEEIMNATKMWFSGMGENHILPVENTDVGVWLLISTLPDPYPQCCQSSGAQQRNIARCWRLALLVKNTVIMGKTIDSGVAAVASPGCGIFGRCDGLVYKWDLSTGDKLENLHHFRGSEVSCISTDNTDSGALAIASEGQLLVYAQS